MPSSHCWMQPYSKSGTDALATRCRYLEREGEFAPAAYMERTSARTKDYEDFVCSGTQHLPAWAHGNASLFFREADRAEGANRYVAFTINVSLPRELTHAQHLALTQDFLRVTMPDLPALWVKHDKRLASGEMHPHLHILFSARRMDGIARGPTQMFKRWQAKSPERGGAPKDGFWSQRQAPAQLRYAFADVVNTHLERAGIQERIDVRSLATRGLERLPQRWGTDVQLSAADRAREQAQAAATWEQRKVFLGIQDISLLSPEAFAQRARAAMRGFTPGTALPTVSPAEVHAYTQRQMQRLSTSIMQHTTARALLGRAMRLLDDAERRYHAAPGNAVVLRKLEYVLSKNPDEEESVPHHTPFQFQKEHDLSR